MYKEYFGFRENPFSIAPDPRYLYPSEMHQDALAHLRFGAAAEGGIILLTGEVGTGKTTLCRCFLEQIEPDAHVALIVNPGLSAPELLATVCDEFRIPVDRGSGTKEHIDALNRFLLDAHGDHEETLLIIDEAQNLDKEALETVRLLTNLETNRRKLLKIILLGQSELGVLLKSPDLVQVNQRITARFHLSGLSPEETADYLKHRISVAGGAPKGLFSARAVKRIHRLTGGIPRMINTLCDRSLLGAFSEEQVQVDEHIVKQAAREVFGFDRVPRTVQIPLHSLAAASAVVLLIIVLWAGSTSDLFHLKLDSILPPAPRQEMTGQSAANVGEREEIGGEDVGIAGARESAAVEIETVEPELEVTENLEPEAAVMEAGTIGVDTEAPDPQTEETTEETNPIAAESDSVREHPPAATVPEMQADADGTAAGPDRDATGTGDKAGSSPGTTIVIKHIEITE